ncbi:MAG: PolC-type DNA polymerase III [Lachnospirales bacterium]
MNSFFDSIDYLGINKNEFISFSECLLEKILLTKDRKSILMILKSREIINEKNIETLEYKLKEKMKSYEKVKVEITYDVNDSEKAISKYKTNLINSFEKSPLEYTILKNANIEYDLNKIKISTDNNSIYLLEKKGAKEKIKSIIYKKFQIEPSVEFIEVEGKKIIDSDFIVRQTIRENIQSEKEVEKEKPQEVRPQRRRRQRNGVKIVESITEMPIRLAEELDQDSEITVTGIIFSFEKREIRSGNYLISMDITDNTNSITIKFFIDPEAFEEEFKNVTKKGNTVTVKGYVRYDTYAKELNIMANEIALEEKTKESKVDNAEVKRVELHLHTNMSSMDALTGIKDYVKYAKKLGHTSIAITDHGVVQAFPDAMNIGEELGVKILYGVEAYIIDDIEAVVSLPKGQNLDSEYVVFDVETTGFYQKTCKIIEIGAAKIKNGEIVDEFNELINPEESLSETIVNLTKITDTMLKNKETIEFVLPKFIEFIGDSILVAHNANFDIGFINANTKRVLNKELENTFIDTVNLSRMLYPNLKNHKLNTVADHLRIVLESHHRAVDDAKATAEIFLKEIEELKNTYSIETVGDINVLAQKNMNVKNIRPTHGVIFAKDEIGLKNLYKLITNSHLENFYRRPRMLKSKILEHRGGLMLGAACEAGEVFKSILGEMPREYIINRCNFYDYLEIQPVGNNMFLYRNGNVKTIEDLCNLNIEVLNYGDELNKLTVATGDVHFLNEKDEFYRRILMNAEGFKDADEQPPLFYRTTEEMLSEFSYLGAERAYEVVVTNTNKISDEIGELLPIPKDTHPPRIEGSDDELKEITMKRAKEIYGEELPKIVINRLNKELSSIFKHGFSVMYIIAQKLVWNSLEAGYLVGSRGSVGSSFVATMAQITEVNPLSPHYVCQSCKYSDFDSEEVLSYSSWAGYDMPDKNCPICGEKLKKDGHNIPFETFLGFDGDKEPDIDLNFSSEYQAKAHAYTEELFGEGYVFKAGTIGTLADKTAAGFVLKYLEEKNKSVRRAEVTRLANGCTGVKRTTGQHPGGLMVVPDYTDVHKFTPLQRPANDVKSSVITTHFDYHSISGKLLKLDILGHTAPTIIKMLHESTGMDPLNVDLGDKDVMSLFESHKALGLKEGQIKCKTGSLGLPEFGTNFVRQMLLDTRPATFTELVLISGLSHGTDVWLNNAQDLVNQGTCTLKEVIATRDDIMVYLISKGIEDLTAFTIMEKVRKGKGLSEEHLAVMKENKVPQWYIESCQKIKYLFPKGHAVAYVLMSVRIGYFKIHYPKNFYAATFSISAEDFDYEIMCKGIEEVKREMGRIIALGNEKTPKDKSSFDLLELLEEMYERDIEFLPIDLYESKANKFTVKENGILPPLCTIAGLGGNAAESIVLEREVEEFSTIEDLRSRTKVNKNVVDIMKRNGILTGIPETNQFSFLEF